jgi:predicted alpha/beta hydrolase family esterase
VTQVAVEGVRVAVLFVQGAGENAHAVDRLMADALARELGDRFQVVFPRVPDEADPDRDAWKRAIAADVRRASATILAAHSAGAANVADMLAEGRCGEFPGVRGLFLLAPPFIGPGGWAFDGFHFDHATDRQAPAGTPLHFYFGSADETVPSAHAALYAAVFPDATVHRLKDCDHQFGGHLRRVARDIRRVAGTGA